MRREFSFDGHGINGPDECRTRLATFTEAGKAYPGLGKLLEAAPELLEELEALVSANYGQPNAVHVPALDNARTIIAKVKGAA